MASTTERFIQASDLELWTESFGDASDPAVLLIMGAMNQGIIWPDEFCTEIAHQGYCVIRYDHRDTGQSSTVYFQMAPYGLDDLAKDAACVLDGYGIPQAHVVGLSMGGYVAQLLALNDPQRVLSLSLLMSSPDPEVYMAATMGRDTRQYRLPPPSPRFLKYVAKTQRNPPIIASM